MGGFVFLALIPSYVGVVITHHLAVAAFETVLYVKNGY